MAATSTAGVLMREEQFDRFAPPSQIVRASR
jgi:hypothetical protein